MCSLTSSLDWFDATRGIGGAKLGGSSGGEFPKKSDSFRP
jgi:hypothetical protein